jgi:phage major head subunit gpT-like protein
MFKGFNTTFNEVHQATTAHWPKVAMDLKSSGSEEVYGWLTAMPQMREWLGDRVVHGLSKSDYVIKNRKFEATIRIPREHIEDDKLGIYGPQLRMMAYNAATHPDELVFEVMKTGFDTVCYDGQFFFDTDHPVIDAEGVAQSVSNFQGGTGTPWYILDTSRPVKPFVFQERIPYTPQRMDTDDNPYVFLRDEYLYGMRARVNAGLGLWQLAYASKQPLTAENYGAARAAMQTVKYDGGRIMGLTPTVLVVPPTLEYAARELLNSERINGSDNPWRSSAELLVTPHLAD